MTLFGGVDIDIEFSERLKQYDPKTAVNQFCQRYCHRPILKEDVKYSTTRHNEGYQATVKVNCLEGKEFAGDLSPTIKAAEMSAAQQILVFFDDVINSMPKMDPNGNKRKRQISNGVSCGALEEPLDKSRRVTDLSTEPNPALSPKMQLNSVVLRIIRRPLEKETVRYETFKVDGGYQAQAAVPKLPGGWGKTTWAGEVRQTKKLAEQSVAQVILDTLRADPELMERHNAPARPKTWLSGVLGVLPPAPHRKNWAPRGLPNAKDPPSAKFLRELASRPTSWSITRSF
jgi:dsRNA-specific ribonuclease